jgi:biotin-dependent carboxylase-like uncharacterized protein
MTTLRIEQVHLRATVQDLGRPGLAHLGVPTAGAVDTRSLCHANGLVGNQPDAAAIEVVLRGLTFRCAAPTRVAVVGAAWSVDGVEMPPNSACEVGADGVVTVGACTEAYAYVAVGGGLDVPRTLGSRSTDTLAGLGPAPLRTGDELTAGTETGSPYSTATQASGPLRVVPGPRDDWFGDDALATLLGSDWSVTPQSDRTGIRLSGPRLERRRDDELASEGIITGAIQVPPDGQPIVFLANHPTTGGYPVIAVLVAPDVDRAAQHGPGTRMLFTLTR